MQRVVATRARAVTPLTRSCTPDILHDRMICSGREADLLRPPRRFHRRGDDGAVHDLLRPAAPGALCVLVHHLPSSSWSRLPQLTPMRTGLRTSPPPRPSGRTGGPSCRPCRRCRVDAVLRERLGAGRKLGEQAVAVVVEVADQRHVDAHAVELLADVRHGLRRLGRVDGDAHQLRTGDRELLDLDGGLDHVPVSVLVIDCTRTGAPPPIVTSRAPAHHGLVRTARRCRAGLDETRAIRGRRLRASCQSSSLQFHARDVVARDAGQRHRLAAEVHLRRRGIADR